MSRNLEAAVWGSLCADSLALAAHWEYDPVALEKKHGRVEELGPAAAGGYHDGKGLGEFTHYGDQTFALLESVKANQGFDLADFADRWQKLFDGYQGYFDGATKGALANFKAGAMPDASGANSHDLAGASRIAPLVWGMAGKPQELIEAARAQTKMTHNNQVIIDSAEFFARAALAIIDGKAVAEALGEAAKAPYATAEISAWLERGLASKGADTVEVIQGLGASCAVGGAFPGVIHLLAKHGHDLRIACVENVMAGGDSASRGLIVGMLLGLSSGLDAVPESWRDRLAKRQAIADLLA